ncbi:hypothetical protein Q4555_07670 [Octadecabacter sp. 1_MG-2023]|uniref:hypothetical protein n=1 Tax=unclassified Octadecabacter TaxID=196158 RepID=UPI001C08AED1|nr:MULTISPECIES: hypothetical protein [unclassified Octadecabacter]MBU2994169.1 hypothetical protein [Octadecabacter sp. B2R22]MDO6734542.1 hypothetical protein [Octadecabacter sp. 1_MG-2023]
MSNLPPLEDGEVVMFDHVPSFRAFKRTALLMIALTVPAVVVFLIVFPDTLWPAVPMFVTCVILMQERVRLGRYRAWITNKRVIFQGERFIALDDIKAVGKRGNGVRLAWENGGKGSKLLYPEDADALIAAIETAKDAA